MTSGDRIRKQFFEDMAACWDERFGTADVRRRVERVAKRFSWAPGCRILDVGSGTGIMVPFLLDTLREQGFVWAVDYAASMVREIRGKFGDNRKVSCACADAHALPFQCDAFDVTVCFGVFPHFERPAAVLAEIRRVLAPHGELIIAHALSSAEIKNHHGKAAPVRHDCLPEQERLIQLHEAAGFRILEYEDAPGLFYCRSCKV